MEARKIEPAQMQGARVALEGVVEKTQYEDGQGSGPLVTNLMSDPERPPIEAGADTALANNEGSTPLHIAAFLCRTEIVQALLDSGADRDARNHAGSTP